MKITYVLPHGWRFAGWSLSDFVERYHFSKHVASVIAELGHDVTLVGLHESVKAPTVLQSEPFKIEILPISFSIPPFRFGGDVSLTLLRAVATLRSGILHIHGCFDESLPLLVRAASIPIVLHWHGGWLPPLHRLVFRRAYQHARRIVVPFAAVRDQFSSVPPSDRKLEVIPLPLRPEVRAAEPKSTYGRHVPRLLYVGRIPRSGNNLGDRRLDLLLRLLGRMRHTEFHLDIAGDGPGHHACEEIARKEEIERFVTFHGYRSLQDLLSFYKDSDLTVVPFSLTDLTGTWVAQVQESLSLGTPVIAFSPDGEYYEHEIGWRISADPVDGANQLERILSDPEGIEARGRRGPSLVRRLCNERDVARRLDSLYRAL